MTLRPYITVCVFWLPFLPLPQHDARPHGQSGGRHTEQQQPWWEEGWWFQEAGLGLEGRRNYFLAAQSCGMDEKEAARTLGCMCVSFIYRNKLLNFLRDGQEGSSQKMGFVCLCGLGTNSFRVSCFAQGRVKSRWAGERRNQLLWYRRNSFSSLHSLTGVQMKWEHQGGVQWQLPPPHTSHSYLHFFPWNLAQGLKMWVLTG